MTTWIVVLDAYAGIVVRFNGSPHTYDAHSVPERGGYQPGVKRK
jgi:hypothetical protein